MQTVRIPVCVEQHVQIAFQNTVKRLFFFFYFPSPSFFSLLALGLKHFEGTEFPKPLISKYLLPTKTAHQLTVRIKNLNMNRAPDNIIRVSDVLWIGVLQI